jgi:hypothetical protein
VRFRRIPVERGGITQRHPHVRLLALGADEGMDQCAQTLGRRSPGVLEDLAQHVGGLPPLVALQSEEDRRLVREVLVQRTDADARLLGDPGRGETMRPFRGQNLSSRFENRGDEVVGTRLLGLFSRGNKGIPALGHDVPRNANRKPDESVAF